MAISMESYINNMQAYQNSGISQMKLMNQMFDYKSAQKQTQSLIDSYKQNNNAIKTLKNDTADFLKQYTTGMNNMNSAAGKLTNGGISSLMQGKDGAVTKENIANTVSAVRSMVDEYNNNLKTLGENTSRGPGVQEQINRMQNDPAPRESMEMVGVSVNKDGSLALDEEKLTSALSTEDENQRKLYEDIIGGASGLARGIQADARAGANTSAGKLVSNDIAKMQSIRDDDPIRNFAQSIRGGGAYALNNTAAMGILMNMVV